MLKQGNKQNSKMQILHETKITKVEQTNVHKQTQSKNTTNKMKEQQTIQLDAEIGPVALENDWNRQQTKVYKNYSTRKNCHLLF